jgi:RNA polymerase sigma factor (sigma-70 family)
MGAEAPPNSGQIAEAVLLDQSRRRKLLAYAFTRFGISTQDGEDLFQDSAVELLRYKGSIRSPEGFLFAVFHTQCARFAEKRGAENQSSSSMPSDHADAFAAQDRPYRQLVLREGLDFVSPSCRRLLRAYYGQGQTLREAARTVSLAYSGVAKTISRCLQKLRSCLS